MWKGENFGSTRFLQSAVYHKLRDLRASHTLRTHASARLLRETKKKLSHVALGVFPKNSGDSGQVPDERRLET
jgi:hypothetical protein